MNKGIKERFYSKIGKGGSKKEESLFQPENHLEKRGYRLNPKDLILEAIVHIDRADFVFGFSELMDSERYRPFGRRHRCFFKKNTFSHAIDNTINSFQPQWASSSQKNQFAGHFLPHSSVQEDPSRAYPFY